MIPERSLLLRKPPPGSPSTSDINLFPPNKRRRWGVLHLKHSVRVNIIITPGINAPRLFISLRVVRGWWQINEKSYLLYCAIRLVWKWDSDRRVCGVNLFCSQSHVTGPPNDTQAISSRLPRRTFSHHGHSVAEFFRGTVNRWTRSPRHIEVASLCWTHAPFWLRRPVSMGHWNRFERVGS